jgi:threonine efflux protein
LPFHCPRGSAIPVTLSIAGNGNGLRLCVADRTMAAGRIGIAAVGGPRSGISVSRAFLLGLITQLSNPKTSIVYASIFAALMPPAPPLWLLFALPPMLFCIEAGWYAVVAFVFSGSRARQIYARLKLWIDRGAGAVMGALGLKLMVEAIKAKA